MAVRGLGMSKCPVCGTPYIQDYLSHEFGMTAVELQQCECEEEE